MLDISKLGLTQPQVELKLVELDKKSGMGANPGDKIVKLVKF